jgi:signal recognition particle GTPase
MGFVVSLAVERGLKANYADQVLLVAGDTFRAAAAEQLAGWAERSKAELAAATSQKQRPDALMYSAIDRVSFGLLM